jgi:hypothetical protein
MKTQSLRDISMSIDVRVIGPDGRIKWEAIAWMAIGIVTGWWIAFLNLVSVVEAFDR